jgi:antitoxin (DNA-binding transcriptional repressor) of toxin-antitoxin stability system
MSEAELARDLSAVLEKVRQGAEVIVERNHQPVAVLRAAAPPRGNISESIAMAERRDRERGYAVTLDADSQTWTSTSSVSTRPNSRSTPRGSMTARDR